MKVCHTTLDQTKSYNVIADHHITGSGNDVINADEPGNETGTVGFHRSSATSDEN